MATGLPGVKVARCRSAPSNQGSSDPGGTTVPFSSSQIRPWRVSHPTRTVNRGAGFGRCPGSPPSGWPSPPGRRPGAAWGCGTGGRRAPGHGRGSLWPRPGRPRTARAPGVRALRPRWSPLIGSRVMAPSQFAVEALDQVDLPAGPQLLAVLVGPVGIGQLSPVGGDPGRTGQRAASLAWSTNMASSRARASSVSTHRRETMHVHVVAGDVPVRPGPLGLGQEPQRPAPAHLAFGLALLETAARW